MITSFASDMTFNGPRIRRTLAAALIAVTAPWLAACETNPATGERMISLMSPEEEQKIGAAESPKAVQEFGGLYKDPELTRYIDSIGQLLAHTTETPDQKFSFVVIDTDVVNAFALPGGYVHVTRGLLALANNEAEAAGVIAHETGHVVARHAAQRDTQAKLGGIGALVGGLLLGDIGAQVGQFGAGAYVAKYSREQEFEADSLGVRYLRRAGFDPEAMADFLSSLEANSELESKVAGAKDPSMDIMASHPRTPDRVRAAIKEAGAGAPVKDPIEGRDVYLRKIDGLIYGDSPNNGFVRGNRFAHPVLRFGFEVPQNFKLINQPDQVVAQGPQGAAILFSQAQVNAAPADYLRQISVGGAQLGNIQRTTVNGMEAATGALSGNTQKGPVELRVLAVRLDANSLYQFISLAPGQAAGQANDAFQRTVNSFHRLSPQEAASLKPLRIKVVQVQAGDTVQSLAARTAFPDYKVERFMVLNGLKQGEALRPGQLIKLVVEGDAVKQTS
jgi:predicted Zn-dependent protease